MAFLWALAGAGTAAAVAYKAGALRGDGAVAAAVVGFVICRWGGAGGAALLLLFFVSASGWTAVAGRRSMTSLPPGTVGSWTDGSAPGRRRPPRAGAGRRSAAQVAANGLIPALAVVGHTWWPSPLWSAAFAGALAAVTADTWATELGKFSPRPPVVITTGQRGVPGQSGAVSFIGTAGGLLGALVLAGGGGVALSRWPLGAVVPGGVVLPDGLGGPVGSPTRFIAAVAAAGGLGMLMDSVLGATVQARFWCPRCRVGTEAPRHRCGTPTRLVGGLRWLTNGGVNFCASAVGALVAAGLMAF